MRRTVFDQFCPAPLSVSDIQTPALLTGIDNPGMRDLESVSPVPNGEPHSIPTHGKHDGLDPIGRQRLKKEMHDFSSFRGDTTVRMLSKNISL
jgi:hypothetical protein